MSKLRLELRYKSSKHSTNMSKLRLDLRYKFSGNPKKCKNNRKIINRLTKVFDENSRKSSKLSIDLRYKIPKT